MHPKSKDSVASSCNWQSVCAIALVIGGALAICPSGLAEKSFPPPSAARPAVRYSGLDRRPLGETPVPQPATHDPLGPVTASWEGMPNEQGYEPPDPHGAAGPNGIIQTVNLQIKYWRKSGIGIWGPVDLADF